MLGPWGSGRSEGAGGWSHWGLGAAVDGRLACGLNNRCVLGENDGLVGHGLYT